MAVCFFGIFAVTGLAAADEPSLETAPFELVEVSESVAMALHDNGSNITCVATQSGLVFFDAGLSTGTALRFRQEMEARFEKPTRALVLTHAHLDHILGMAAFDDVPVYAAAAGRPRWDHFLAVEWDERAIAGYGSIFPTLPEEISDARLRLPTDWFGDVLELGTEDAPVSIRRTGGHTIDSSSARITADGVIIAGDLVQARRRPYFGEPDTDFEAWIGALKDWEDAAPMAVCGGHGPVIDAAELGAIRVWFEEMATIVKALKGRGVPLEAMVSNKELPAGYWPDEDAVPRWWGFCLKRLYDASVIPAAETAPDDLVAAADRALYEAKHNGRNRVELAAAVD